ncbi:hypothetical protein JOC74_004008 [Bacillus capparidis]|uniref:Uncharacterized protein n=1 Tax=Bacillus capparidis TaxID=1840411 RepID=A0ABS4D1L3_9BACI|nr:hypothetical protein [Bacillus capparidis]
MNLEHPIISEINRYGYPLEYLQYDTGKDEEDEAKQN